MFTTKYKIYIQIYVRYIKGKSVYTCLQLNVRSIIFQPMFIILGANMYKRVSNRYCRFHGGHVIVCCRASNDRRHHIRPLTVLLLLN